MKRFLPIVVLLLAACSDRPLVPLAQTLPSEEQDTCGASPYARLLGQEATALERELILRQVRVIRPGEAVTMDFRPVRLNFEVGPSGQIVRIFCG